MHFSSAEIVALLGSYLWPFTRIGAMLVAAPVFGANSVSVRVRIALALAITVVVVPLLPPVPPVDPVSLAGVMLLAQQVLIGAAMGFSVQLVFGAILIGAQMIAMNMGLGFASMVDPQYGQQVPVLGQLFLVMTTLVFLAINGHLMLIQVVVDSFHTLPIGGGGLQREAMWQIALWGSHMFAGAVLIAIPASASLLLVNIAFGVMTRSAPQMNIFSVGFPITMMVGFGVILFVLPAIAEQFTKLLGNVFVLMRDMTNLEL